MGKRRNEVIDKILLYAKDNSGSSSCKLPSEREMASLFGVSRVLLREAIVALEVMGLLEIRGRQGIYVKEPQLDFIEEELKILPILPEKFLPQFFEVRTIIEVNAARIAALRRTDEQLREIELCLARLKTVIENGEDLPIRARYEFILHYLIVEATNNDIMKKIYESLRVLMEKYHVILHKNLTREPCWEKHVLEDQSTIYDAIKRRDAALAEEVMKRHMRQIVELYDELKGHTILNI